MAVLNKEQQNILLTPPVRRLIQALDGKARVVGGAVRDVLMGCAVGDIDLATPLAPDKVMTALGAQDIKAVPTGIDHGTITAVLARTGYEITTLRQDVETFGRHARVEYTDDWRADAARRDFTMNALYVDAAGVLYDYVGGARDAEAGRVRFIGDARQRIKEDVLRILRFFRFYACFGKGAADREALAACRELAPLIPALSVERTARELLKLLAAGDPLPAVMLMGESGVISQVLPEATDFSRLKILLETERKYGAAPSSLRRLAALLPGDAARAVAARLKFSNQDTKALGILAKLPERMEKACDPKALHALIYDYGKEMTRSAALFLGADTGAVLKEIELWEVPDFPLKGKDLLALGIPAGPHVGKILRAVEAWWRDRDFEGDREAALAQAGKIWEKTLDSL